MATITKVRTAGGATAATPVNRGPRFSRRWRPSSILGMMVMIVSSAAFIIPVLWLLIAPTKTRGELTGGDSPLSFGDVSTIGETWSRLMTYNDGQVVRWLINSLGYSLGAVVLTLLMAIPAGYALSMYDFRGRRAVLTATLIAMIIPQAALILPLYLEMVWLGLINTVWSVVLPMALFPFGVYLTYLYYNESLPRSLIEAARLDGASETKIFLLLGLPLVLQPYLW